MNYLHAMTLCSFKLESSFTQSLTDVDKDYPNGASCYKKADHELLLTCFSSISD